MTDPTPPQPTEMPKPNKINSASISRPINCNDPDEARMAVRLATRSSERKSIELATAIERSEKAEAENARLREALEMVRAKAIHHDPEFTGQRTNDSMPRWNGVVQKIDAALHPTPHEKSPMTQLNDLPTTELMQAGETFARLGLECPWVGEGADVDLEHMQIRGMSPGLQEWVYNPRRVADAVVAFTGEVRAWWKLEHQRGSSLEMDWLTRRWDQCVDLPSGNSLGCQHDSQLSAAAALIVAVAKIIETDYKLMEIS